VGDGGVLGIAVGAFEDESDEDESDVGAFEDVLLRLIVRHAPAFLLSILNPQLLYCKIVLC
jgi:hypothetical protein